MIFIIRRVDCESHIGYIGGEELYSLYSKVKILNKKQMLYWQGKIEKDNIRDVLFNK